MPNFSIVTIVKGRRKQLSNLLNSIQFSTILPVDIQIVCMDEPDEILIPEGLAANIHRIISTHALPLAAARNMGIKASKTENIIFIDVDCMVSPSLFESMMGSLQFDKVITAYPLYLPMVPEGEKYSELVYQAVSHPARIEIPFGEPVPHLHFWSLIFAIKKQTFNKIDGFDESFTGYGAEDTDFAMTFHKIGVELLFVNDYVLHQYHKKYDPPVNYFDSIIDNARKYQKKWNVLPMQKWLRAFEALGLINIDQNKNINIIQKPTANQIKKSISTDPY